ncbi:MAG: succinate dehydrogenase [Myxococcaceae bacterium]|nr:succinate dehydrogenase [Myxococcaceae bacterium]
MAATTENLSDRKAATAGTRPFLWARLGSLLSILPLGVWTVNHLADNLGAFKGAEVWERQVTQYNSPISHVITLVVVLGPLVIHAAWGIQRLFSFRPNNVAYPFWGNLKYLVQRIAAVGVLLFIGAHLWLALLHPRLVEGHAEPFSDIASAMRHHWPTLVVYLLGTLGVAYHLANGVSTFSWMWGAVGGRRSLARFDIVAAVVFFVVLAMAWGVIYALYQAGAAFPPMGAET